MVVRKGKSESFPENTVQNVCVCVLEYVYLHIHIYKCEYMYTHIFTNMNICAHIYLYILVCKCMHTHIYTLNMCIIHIHIYFFKHHSSKPKMTNITSILSINLANLFYCWQDCYDIGVSMIALWSQN